MYEWWRTPDGHEDIDRFRHQLLIGIVNQKIGQLPSSLKMAKYMRQKDLSKSTGWPATEDYNEDDWAEGNKWFDFLQILKVFMPRDHDYEYVMASSAEELSMLICGTKNPGNYNPEKGEFPINDPELLDLLADFFAGLDGIFGLILATNPHISAELRNELLNSDYYLVSEGGISTRSLCKRFDEIENYPIHE